jgi:hypothetical protein
VHADDVNVISGAVQRNGGHVWWVLNGVVPNRSLAPSQAMAAGSACSAAASLPSAAVLRGSPVARNALSGCCANDIAVAVHHARYPLSVQDSPTVWLPARSFILRTGSERLGLSGTPDSVKRRVCLLRLLAEESCIIVCFRVLGVRILVCRTTE